MRGHCLYSAATHIVLHLVCRASELKEELNRLGLPSTGSRQQLEERLMHHYETAQDAQYEALAAQVALLSMSIIFQKCHSYTRTLHTESRGDNKNVFLHCGDVVGHSSLLRASGVFMPSMYALPLCCVPAATHCCASCTQIRLLHGQPFSTGSRWLAAWLLPKQHSAATQHQLLWEVCLLTLSKKSTECNYQQETAQYSENSTEHAEEGSRNQHRTCIPEIITACAQHLSIHK